MQKSFTAVIERNATFTGDFETEPYEAGWAIEARWFIRILEISGEATELLLYPQISPDGLFWCDDPEAGRLLIREDGLHSFYQRNFGHWLRCRGSLSGPDARVKAVIYLALKG